MEGLDRARRKRQNFAETLKNVPVQETALRIIRKMRGMTEETGLANYGKRLQFFREFSQYREQNICKNCKECIILQGKTRGGTLVNVGFVCKEIECQVKENGCCKFYRKGKSTIIQVLDLMMRERREDLEKMKKNLIN